MSKDVEDRGHSKGQYGLYRIVPIKTSAAKAFAALLIEFHAYCPNAFDSSIKTLVVHSPGLWPGR